MNQLTPAQLQTLLQFASAKLGVPADQLASTVSSGGYEALVSSLSENSRRTLETLIADKSQAEKLLSSPQVQEFLKRYR